ncbi:cobalamin biosynthesis protein CbiX [Nocardiopsis terrae]|uniref:Sirohydrochlorin ferrochelatase n=1 Tax=Nocardiopsis terrae TaxID=372655 RepID=A0ABR9HHG3_9ACTN|nr:CbiX/SirB N-terminal domain-containing protein [Nocardiopsis terrae]MBE1458469.1 sirohydrochlorin ferrochelatase [Nocardiopsis terrae]GHC80275.1 cobalamin biosynthesis protein CbiX [Nocardiopsis terrae]
MLNHIPTLLLAVHGTRSPRGTAVAHSLALRVAEITHRPTRLAFADVLDPTVEQVAATTPGPLVVVPAFLTSGYHVRTDIPHQLALAGRADAVITPALGDHPALTATARKRLEAAGHRPGDALVLGCAGTSDPHAQTELDQAAERLSQQMDTPVHLAYAATNTPTVADKVTELRTRGHTRISVAAWLLAPGLFHDRLSDSGADTVAAPLCPDAAVAHAVADRYLSACLPQPART